MRGNHLHEPALALREGRLRVQRNRACERVARDERNTQRVLQGRARMRLLAQVERRFRVDHDLAVGRYPPAHALPQAKCRAVQLTCRASGYMTEHEISARL